MTVICLPTTSPHSTTSGSAIRTYPKHISGGAAHLRELTCSASPVVREVRTDSDRARACNTRLPFTPTTSSTPSPGRAESARTPNVNTSRGPRCTWHTRAQPVAPDHALSLATAEPNLAAEALSRYLPVSFGALQQACSPARHPARDPRAHPARAYRTPPGSAPAALETRLTHQHSAECSSAGEQVHGHRMGPLN
jgi:hypothetical protein